jgi:hypothetical protein
MDEAKAISIANRAHAKKRWAKASPKERYDAGRRMTDAGKRDRVAVPRLQDTRTTQVLSKSSASTSDLPSNEAHRMTMQERVSQTMAVQQEGAPAGYWGQAVLKNVAMLELFAEDYVAAGQVDKAVQIHMVLLKYLTKVYLAQEPNFPNQFSAEEAAALAEQDAALEAKLAGMSIEELRVLAQR